MAQRQPIGGRRPWILWLAVILLLVLAIGVAAMVFVIGPQQQLRQQTQATAKARQAEVERLYQAGIAFQSAGDCAKAAESLSQVIDMEPSYKDAQGRLAEARACRQAVEATSTAQAIAVAEATAEAQAVATSEARTLAETNAATATAAAQAGAATATAEAAAAIETAYQRGVGYYNLERWADAKAAFEEVIAVDPTYKDVQTMLPEVEAQLAEAQTLTPTALPASTSTPQPAPRAEGPPWWDAGYASRQQLTIGNNADGPLPAGYSVKLSLIGEKATDFFRQSTSAQLGKDVRILYWSENQWQEIDRYVNSFTSSEVSIWFATQGEIPSNGTSESYWIYFNNPEPAEPLADTQKVFLWWDDRIVNTEDPRYYQAIFPVSYYEAKLRKVDGEDGTELANAGKLSFPLDTWHHIRMGAYQDRIEVWLDDTQMAATDTTFRAVSVLASTRPMGISTTFECGSTSLPNPRSSWSQRRRTADSTVSTMSISFAKG